jgi:hypothetical protein
MILWHADPFLGNGRERSNYTTAVTNDFVTNMFARQQLEAATEERCFLCGQCRDVISRTVGTMGSLLDRRQPIRM